MRKFKNKIITYVMPVAFLVALAITAHAQKGEFGIRFMPTISSFGVQSSSGGAVSGQASLGFGIGALLAFNFTKHVGVQAEVIYNSISQNNTEAGVERSVNLKYVNIPLLLSLNTGRADPVNLNFVIGPQMGVNVGSSVTTSGGDATNNSQALIAVKKGDLGFAYGAGLDFGLNKNHTVRLGVGFRGVYGLLNISDNNGTTSSSNNSYYILDKTHIKTYSAYAGLSFLF